MEKNLTPQEDQINEENIENPIIETTPSNQGSLMKEVNNIFVSGKNKWVAFVLCWFLGIFGAHRFYSGKKGTAILMLLISLTLFGIIITAIWATVDWVILLFMPQEDFKNNYVKQK